MRKVIVIEQVTIDGVIQGPGGPQEDTSNGFSHGGWVAPYADDVLGIAIRRELDMPFDLLLGRKTYDIWAAYWPYHGDFWPNVNIATKYVASNTVTSGDWQPAHFFGGDVAAKIAELKQQEAPDLHVYGSANLLQTLIKQDLVDEYRLKVFPVTLGEGKRLFADGTIPAAFKITESIISPSGVIIVTYERAGAIETGQM